MVSADFSLGIHRSFTFQTLLTSNHSDPILHDEIPELENVLFFKFKKAIAKIGIKGGIAKYLADV